MTPDAQRQTIAQGVLNRDVLKTINLSESAWGQGCSTAKVTKVTLVSAPKPDTQSVIKATENWVLDRCGTPVSYRIDYAETPGKGTMIDVKLMK
jgi:hypothetical protein